MSKKRLVSIGSILLSWVAAAPLMAQDSAQPALPASGVFSVSPLRIDMAADAETASLQLKNLLPNATSVQIRVFAWAQQDGKDRYQASEDFIVSPSIIRLDAGANQLVRVLRREGVPADQGQERRYRVVIDQLPGSTSAEQQAANTRLQITIPLFHGSDRSSPAQLTAQISDQQLTLTNAGGRTAHLAAMELTGPDGRTHPVRLDGLRYLHGGTSVSLALPQPVCGQNGRASLRAVVDRSPVNVASEQICP